VKGEGRRRGGDMGKEGAGAELEAQLLRANAQTFALQGMEREKTLAEAIFQMKRAHEELLKAMREQKLQREILSRAVGEELLQAKAQVAELLVGIRIKARRSMRKLPSTKQRLLYLNPSSCPNRQRLVCQAGSSCSCSCSCCWHLWQMWFIHRAVQSPENDGMGPRRQQCCRRLCQ